MAAAKNAPRILIYLLRRDLRLSDNPVFHEIARQYKTDTRGGDFKFTHLLPLYVYPAQQIEVSGFIPSSQGQEPEKSPYPEARSDIAGYWRCGPHRAKFVAESVWDLKESLESRGSGLVVRVGTLADVVRDAINHFDSNQSPSKDGSQKDNDATGHAKVVGVWMTDDENVEERREDQEVKRVVEKHGKEFRLFRDEKYYVDDRDLPYQKKDQLPNVFTEFRKAVEPLRKVPRKPLGIPTKLPPLPPADHIPPQSKPFVIPDSFNEQLDNLVRPLKDFDLSVVPEMPKTWKTEADPCTQNHLSAHPFKGGEAAGLSRVDHLLSSGAMTGYKDTRNGLLGLDFSTKFSAWLALGCITSRQVHAMMLDFEDGESTDKEDKERQARVKRWSSAPGFGKGENKGTAAVRFELLWRDYFRLYARKFGHRMFVLGGVKGDTSKNWKGASYKKGLSKEERRKELDKVKPLLDRFRSGCTGIGLVDASQKELYLTGYTSNRARQNVASFLSKHMNVDWRIGAEWYECMLTDYDTASNWGNWQYVAGVGNDPRQDRIFNPVKQALDYDSKGEYIRTWIPELRDVQVSKEDGGVDNSKLIGVFQAWRLHGEDIERLNLKGKDWVEDPMKRIDFTLNRRPRGGDQERGRGRRNNHRNRGGGGGGGRWRGDTVGSKTSGSSGGHSSRGSSVRGHSPARFT